MRRTKVRTVEKKTQRAPLLMALEPRVMFDGAAAPTAHVAVEVHAAASVQD